MSDFDKDPINNLTADLDSISLARTGKPWDPNTLIENLPLYGIDDRVETLRQFDLVLNNCDVSDIREFSRLSRLRRDADLLHHKLRRAGR